MPPPLLLPRRRQRQTQPQRPRQRQWPPPRPPQVWCRVARGCLAACCESRRLLLCVVGASLGQSAAILPASKVSLLFVSCAAFLPPLPSRLAETAAKAAAAAKAKAEADAKAAAAAKAEAEVGGHLTCVQQLSQTCCCQIVGACVAGLFQHPALCTHCLRLVGSHHS